MPSPVPPVYSLGVEIAAVPWTYWLALPLVVAGALGFLGGIVAYLVRAVAAKYPRQ